MTTTPAARGYPNLFELPRKQLWNLPVAEARRRLGIPEAGVAVELYRGIVVKPELADALEGVDDVDIMK